MVRRHGPGPVTWRWFSGHPLDGQYRTNATWLHPASGRVFHKTGHAVSWHHMPRIVRAVIRTMGTVLGLVLLLGLAQHRTATEKILACACGAALLLAAWRSIAAMFRWRHHRKYVRPLHYALAGTAGVAIGARPRDWLTVSPDRTKAVIKMPASFAGKPAVQKQVETTVTAKLAIEAPEHTWDLEGAKPRLTTRSRPAPPRKVAWDDVQAFVAQATATKPVIGLGRGGGPLALDLGESPHILLSVPTGGGKSVLLRMLMPGMLAAGGTVAAVLDIKWISHAWVKGGLPNVLLCQRVGGIHTFLAWLHDEIHRRNEVAWAGMDIEGRIHGDVGPRIVVCIEELNSTTTELRRHWRDIRERSDPDLSPAIDGLNIALLMGRQVKVHVIVAGQQVTALSVGGGVSRENLGTRILGRYSPAHWRMLAEQIPMPPVSRHPGRVQVVCGDEVRECQVAEISGAQAVELALMSVTPWPSTLPLSLRHGVSIAATGDGGSHQPDAVVTVTPAPLPPGRDAIRLSDAVAFGILPMSLVAARKASFRPGFPRPAGWHGTARTYTVDDLTGFVESRPHLLRKAS